MIYVDKYLGKYDLRIASVIHKGSNDVEVPSVRFAFFKVGTDKEDKTLAPLHSFSVSPEVGMMIIKAVYYYHFHYYSESVVENQLNTDVEVVSMERD
jgi:hypothetical protein